MIRVNEEACARNGELLDETMAGIVAGGVAPCLTAAIVKGDELVYRLAYGHSTLAANHRRPIGPTTAFNVGSITKIVTSALAIKLMERGVWSMNDPVRRFVPEYPFADVAIKHLLTHSSGSRKQPIANPAPGEMEAFLRDVYATMEREAAPGERAVYDTTNHEIMMDMIQRATGQPIERFARTSLFDPLGMEHTSYNHAVFADGEYVLPCTTDNLLEDTQFDRRAPRGGTGMFSTAENLVKFGSLFLNKGRYGDSRVFSAAAIDFMLRECTGGKFAKTPVMFAKTERDLHGCFADLNSPRAVGHPGFSGCMLMIDPEYDVAAVIVTNSQLLHRDWRNYKRLLNALMGGATSA